jgi:hypothetical protein
VEAAALSKRRLEAQDEGIRRCGRELRDAARALVRLTETAKRLNDTARAAVEWYMAEIKQNDRPEPLLSNEAIVLAIRCGRITGGGGEVPASGSRRMASGTGLCAWPPRAEDGDPHAVASTFPQSASGV